MTVIRRGAQHWLCIIIQGISRVCLPSRQKAGFAEVCSVMTVKIFSQIGMHKSKNRFFESRFFD